METSILKKEGHKTIPTPRRVDNNVNNSKDDGDANIDIFSSKRQKEYESPPWWPQKEEEEEKEAAEKR